MRRIFSKGLAAALAATFMLTTIARAEDKEAKSAAVPNSAADKADASDRYAVPEGDDVAALAKFLQGLMTYRPTSRDDQIQFRTKAPAAVQEAAERIVKLEKNHKSPAYKLARKTLLQFKLQSTALTGSAEENKELLAEIVQVVKDDKSSTDSLQLATSYAGLLEYKQPELAKTAYEQFAKLAAESKSPKAKEIADSLAGTLRRLNLVGHPMELKGTTLAGKPFDIESLKGKVVLVDFWATWCGPCIGEQPNIRRNYEAYKDRGFEVVGVSIDQDREALEKFVANEDVDWITLHEKDSGWEHPALKYYGITGIPAMFLIGKDGNVVSTRARGEELNRLLEGLLGPADKGAAGEKKK
jgi:thiol-disulfide isomerase/thioredoxin